MKKRLNLILMMVLGFMVISCNQPAGNSGIPTTPSGGYKIGDTGPAGGLIFYVNTDISLGFTYLEAAPADLSDTYAWGAMSKNVAGTSFDIGSGKANTALIIEFLKTSGANGNPETDKAAQMAAAHTYGGKTDWFLPSKYELDLMYKNLKVNALGNFIDDVGEEYGYWSSSQKNDYVHSAWFQYFNNDHNSYYVKNKKLYVRPIREF